jgi:post-segregation antitoxin (ccd killing protein)
MRKKKENDMKEHSKHLKIWVDTNLVETFRAKCVSMSAEISALMARRVGSGARSRGMAHHTTRRDRRMGTQKAIATLAAIRDSEERYMENISENLRGGDAYESACETVEAIEQAIAILEEAF